MKKAIASLVLFLTIVVGNPLIAMATTFQEGLDKAAGSTGGVYTAGSPTQLTDNIGLVIEIILSLLGIVFLILLVYAGYLWMTAQGDSKQVEKAQKMIQQTIIGLVIILAAYAITALVIKSFQI
ncbi:MAG: hypothetical protein NT091_00720 [Candidatus Falkowbacteria bacterium]|nr:hypothetical protein [Candidatus Falkowbacteria bacterium]